jgi:hypothetical protein
VTVFRVSEKRPPGQFFASFSEKRNLFGKTCVFVIVSVVEPNLFVWIGGIHPRVQVVISGQRLIVLVATIMGLADKDTNFVGLKLVKSNPHKKVNRDCGVTDPVMS